MYFRRRVLVIYHSQQCGDTEACAELLAQGVREAGDIAVELINTNEANRVSMESFLAADGVAIGTPDCFSYPAGTVERLSDDLLEAYRADKPVYQRPCALFVPHGGGGGALEPFKRLARDFPLVGEPSACHWALEPDCADEAVALIGSGRGPAQLA